MDAFRRCGLLMEDLRSFTNDPGRHGETLILLTFFFFFFFIIDSYHTLLETLSSYSTLM